VSNYLLNFNRKHPSSLEKNQEQPQYLSRTIADQTQATKLLDFLDVASSGAIFFLILHFFSAFSEVV
jgi:hypothetical protein